MTGAAVGGEEPARPHRAVVAETLEPARSQEQDREPHGSLRLDRAVAAVESRLSQVEDRIERLESGYRGAGAAQIEEELVRLATRVARIEDRIRVLTAFLETKDEAAESRGDGADADPGAAEPRGDGADADSGAAEPRGDGADADSGAAESRGDGADAHSGAADPGGGRPRAGTGTGTGGA